jgi:CubicO group peptidase (beta-lactamase class C family)
VYSLVDTSEVGQGRNVGDSRYNNLNYIVLGEVIEAVSGRSYASAVRRDLIVPARLDRVWVQDDERPAPPIAAVPHRAGHPQVEPGEPYLPFRAIVSAFTPAGGMAADAPTVAAWGQALYSGEVIPPGLVEQMTARPDGGEYGLGTEIALDTAGRPTVGHGGDIGLSYSTLVFWPKDDVAVAVLSPQPAAKPLRALAERLHNRWVAAADTATTDSR